MRSSQTPGKGGAEAKEENRALVSKVADALVHKNLWLGRPCHM